MDDYAEVLKGSSLLSLEEEEEEEEEEKGVGREENEGHNVYLPHSPCVLVPVTSEL